MKKIDILIEPIFSGRWFKNRPVNKIPKILSLKKYNMGFKVTALSGDYDESLTLGPTNIRSSNGEFNRYCPEQVVINSLKKGVQEETPKIEIVFPYQGLFWIDVKVHSAVPTEITTFQITLEGDRGRGAPRDSSDGTLKRDICRNGVAVFDLFTSQLKNLTWVLAVLAGIPIIFSFVKWLIDTLICQ